MSLEELEQQVQHLPTPDLAKFAEWFDAYRDAGALSADEASNETATAQKQELLRRHAEYLANPSLATAWDDGFFDRLRQRLADARAQKTSSR
jgi:hypothetical protein